MADSVSILLSHLDCSQARGLAGVSEVRRVGHAEAEAGEEVITMRRTYYREPNGDYLAIHGKGGDAQLFEGRAAAIEGLPSSMATTGVHKEFLRTCIRVNRDEVPREWLQWIG